MNVGFVGLGSMGREMAGQLLAAGHRVQVWNRSPLPVRALVGRGAQAADSLPEVLRNEVVVSMLSDDAAVESLLLDEELLAGAGAEVHVNMATVSPALAVRAAELHARHGIGYVAAPVLGRTDVAAAGNLNIIAAGASSLIDRVAPLFDAMGRTTWRLGERPELANVAKISANFLLVSAIEAFAEAAALAEASGLATEQLLAILTGTILPGPVYSGYGAMIAERRYEPAGFRLALGLKDIGLALDAGAEAGVPLPFGEVLRGALLSAVAHGDGDLDLAALGEAARRRAVQ
ncbi:3-hydroxyisobutyrate dehydrogenase-like beta-hydroxyacid dehydrogenase [Kitasatospora sp. MAP12-15]|uniref:NAD(P)-dependent oxidoreductase n=1 Tax=unclassified Kitasatospora TaxID=2633591 RepID=UPI00247339A4|nr:NAD(P)-dependent oxidoreductase [Kitasatospora sp. MAP12-44]MDH6113985.1 3-hydroxyisobutyrate dehydrogenase-like beta-hydroxyacid dehydrogenase [Kitasatospora sp. MAP12-44]